MRDPYYTRALFRRIDAFDERHLEFHCTTCGEDRQNSSGECYSCEGPSEEDDETQRRSA